LAALPVVTITALITIAAIITSAVQLSTVQCSTAQRVCERTFRPVTLYRTCDHGLNQLAYGLKLVYVYKVTCVL